MLGQAIASRKGQELGRGEGEKGRQGALGKDRALPCTDRLRRSLLPQGRERERGVCTRFGLVEGEGNRMRDSKVSVLLRSGLSLFLFVCLSSNCRNQFAICGTVEQREGEASRWGFAQKENIEQREPGHGGGTGWFCPPSTSHNIIKLIPQTKACFVAEL